MAALRLDLIGRYLRPHRRTVLLGAIALVVVNVLRVTIPMEVRSVVDELQEGFSYTGVLRQAGWVVLLASTMGVIRLASRQLIFGVGRQVEVDLRQRLFEHMLRHRSRPDDGVLDLARTAPPRDAVRALFARLDDDSYR